MSIARDPSILTKEQLKSDLVAHNISLPPSDSRKDVYVKLYLKHLTRENQTPLRQKSEFSSDEEDLPEENSQQSKKRAVNNPGKKDRRIEEVEKEVLQLSDTELSQKLKDFNFKAGPIVATTKKIYQKKLINLILAEPVGNPEPFNGTSNGAEDSEEDYSDISEEDDYENDSVDGPEVVLEAPQPERMVRSRVTRLNPGGLPRGETSSTPGRQPADIVTQAPEPPSAGDQVSPLLPLWVKLALLFAAIVFVFLVVSNMENAGQPSLTGKPKPVERV